MDPVTLGAILAAVVGGAGGALGSQVWAGVSALVRRPFRHAHMAEDTAASLPSGVAELAALEQAPADGGLAVALAKVLVARADSDGEFRQALEAWWDQASRIHVGGGIVVNTVSGGIQHGPVLQGRDFTDMTFGSPTVPPPVPPQDPDAR